MTAINVLLLQNEVHIFSDGGHHAGKKLCRIAPKVFPMPEFNALVGWSGPSAHMRVVYDALKNCGARSLPELISLAPEVIRRFMWIHKYSLILVGVYLDTPMGVAVEEGNRATRLRPGNVVKSLPTDVDFDLDDIRSSAIEMMEDQRSRHGVVAGYVVHSCISGTFISTIQIHTWPDLVEEVELDRAHAAKIADLTVQGIKFKGNSVTGSVTRSSAGSMSVPNTAGYPVVFTAYAIYTWTSYASANTGSITIGLSNPSYSSPSLGSQTRNHSGNTSGNPQQYSLYLAAVDAAAAADTISYSYTRGVSVNNGGQGAFPIISVSAELASAFYVKR